MKSVCRHPAFSIRNQAHGTLYQQGELWLLRELVAYSLHMLLVQLERVSAAIRRKAVAQRPRRSQLVHVGKWIMHEPATT